MPILRVLPHPRLCPNGLDIASQPGEILCGSLLKAGIAIEHACEMSLACSTCHVYIREGASSLAEPSDEENDQLDWAWGIDSQSRLSCCVQIGQTSLTIELPRHTRNLAGENGPR